MLSTGVDIPSLEAILFLRPVKSRILYEQMMGRGTRLEKDIGKTHFTVFDAVGVVEYFKNATNFTSPLPSKPSRSNKLVIDEIYNNKNRDYNIKILARRLHRMAKCISSNSRKKFEPYIEDGDIEYFAAKLNDNLTSDWKSTIDKLRDERFQFLLENYERTKDDFVVALEKEDAVDSIYYSIVVRDREYKPEDYLRLFRDFLKNEPNTIEALEILLKRPTDLNTDLLDELRKKLALRPEEFTESRLRRAYGNNLIDIIAMVRSAISARPLLSTKDRVNDAIDQVSKGRNLTEREKEWLILIKDHLQANLMIEKIHFSQIPFSIKGGWKNANKDFHNELESIIVQINRVMVSW
jgi:type I restriction enzyme R subunit